LITRV